MTINNNNNNNVERVCHPVDACKKYKKSPWNNTGNFELKVKNTILGAQPFGLVRVACVQNQLYYEYEPTPSRLTHIVIIITHYCYHYLWCIINRR